MVVLSEGHELELTVLLPCLNEARTVGLCVSKAVRCMHELGVAGEVVVADNGSTDGSQALASDAGARVVPIDHRGYGAALAGGIAAARGHFIIMADAVDSYDLTQLGDFVDELRKGYDLVMGNRFQGGIAPGAMPALHRYLGNPLLTFIGRLLFHSPCRDFHCGMRGFRRDAILQLDLNTTGMEFASEMVAKATLAGCSISEVPTTLSVDGRDRPPHLRSWRDGWRHLRFLLLFSPRWLFLYPGLLLILLGVLAGTILVATPVRLGGVIFDVHTLLYAAVTIMLGYQAVLFSVFTKVYGVKRRLLPTDASFERWFNWFSLEAGLLAGAVAIAIGLAGSVSAVAYWVQSDLGEIRPRVTLRIVIPSALAIVLGMQTIFASFFLSVLGLPQREEQSHEAI